MLLDDAEAVIDIDVEEMVDTTASDLTDDELTPPPDPVISSMSSSIASALEL